jgi:hypothetical protein
MRQRRGWTGRQRVFSARLEERASRGFLLSIQCGDGRPSGLPGLRRLSGGIVIQPAVGEERGGFPGPVKIDEAGGIFSALPRLAGDTKIFFFGNPPRSYTPRSPSPCRRSGPFPRRSASPYRPRNTPAELCGDAAQTSKSVAIRPRRGRGLVRYMLVKAPWTGRWQGRRLVLGRHGENQVGQVAVVLKPRCAGRLCTQCFCRGRPHRQVAVVPAGHLAGRVRPYHMHAAQAVARILHQLEWYCWVGFLTLFASGAGGGEALEPRHSACPPAGPVDKVARYELQGRGQLFEKLNQLGARSFCSLVSVNLSMFMEGSTSPSTGLSGSLSPSPSARSGPGRGPGSRGSTGSLDHLSLMHSGLPSPACPRA